MTASPTRDTTLRLHDGRTLAYCEWGDPGGPATFLFHGNPQSRRWSPGADRPAATRLITVDRPGFGRSDPLPGRTISGWVSDVAELADACGLGRFGVVGSSAGAPYAVAVAAILPARLTGVCITNSQSMVYAFGPIAVDDEDRHILDLIERHGGPAAAIRYAEENRAWAEQLLLAPESLIERERIEDGDRWFFEDPSLAAAFFAGVQEGVRQGAIGAASDSIALLEPWGFSLEDAGPGVHLWHGAQDPRVRLRDAERLTARLPDSILTVWPDAGHLGFVRHWDDVLAAALG